MPSKTKKTEQTAPVIAQHTVADVGDIMAAALISRNAANKFADDLKNCVLKIKPIYKQIGEIKLDANGQNELWLIEGVLREAKPRKFDPYITPLLDEESKTYEPIEYEEAVDTYSVGNCINSIYAAIDKYKTKKDATVARSKDPAIAQQVAAITNMEIE